ncbi:hypothetical protein ACFTAO_08040 [Paenibacillus rhizoplanae]
MFVLFVLFNDYSPILIVVGAVVACIIALIAQFYYPAIFGEAGRPRGVLFTQPEKNNPALYIQYVLANRLDDESRTVMEKLMSKHKQAAVQATFKAAYGLYRNDMAAVREAVPHIRHADYRRYYEMVLLLEEGESVQAREHLESIKKQWMRSALLAEIELKAGNSETAITHAREAVSASRGVQRYVLHKEYERTLPQALEAVS